MGLYFRHLFRYRMQKRGKPYRLTGAGFIPLGGSCGRRDLVLCYEKLLVRGLARLRWWARPLAHEQGRDGVFVN